MMESLYWYFGCGVTVLTLMLVDNWLTDRRRGNDNSVHELPDTKTSGQDKHHSKAADNLALAIASILIILGWPVALYVQSKDWLEAWRRRGREEDAEFAVARECLQERMTVREIEFCERVVDPLKAVPDLPFGHLNDAWRAFLSRVPPGGELWSFTSRWVNTWGETEIRSGYVAVSNGNPEEYFLTIKKVLGDRSLD